MFASDYVGVPEDAERARRYEIWWRVEKFGNNFEVLKQMTSTAGEMLAYPAHAIRRRANSASSRLVRWPI